MLVFRGALANDRVDVTARRVLRISLAGRYAREFEGVGVFDTGLFFKCMGFGLAVAAPVGPMALLCMRRTLLRGWRHGLATGLGIALADACYALVAALGLATISAFMLAHQRPLHAAAGTYLLYLGVRSLSSRADAAAAAAEAPERSSWRAALASAILLTLTNPPTIIMFAAIFAALAPASGFEPASAATTVGGVFAGSMLWWCGITAGVGAFRGAIGRRARRWIDRVSGAVLAAFGLAEVRKAV
jgi:threonine/homoserine/homoserine lactone efflux protein